uniref:Putative secreted protein n=1 Tax=Anopheles darlingi TaxID=43151 RepID=A0A2M4D5B0_ANODA
MLLPMLQAMLLFVPRLFAILPCIVVPAAFNCCDIFRMPIKTHALCPLLGPGRGQTEGCARRATPPQQQQPVEPLRPSSSSFLRSLSSNTHRTTFSLHGFPGYRPRSSLTIIKPLLNTLHANRIPGVFVHGTTPRIYGHKICHFTIPISTLVQGRGRENGGHYTPEN